MKIPEWEKTLEALFGSLGLTEKEARVYRVLLEIGQGPAAKIISKSGLKRGITYAVLKSLEKRGLISKFGKDKKAIFRVEDPQKLMDLVEEKNREIDTLRNSLKEIVPKLTSHYKLTLGKPPIRYFEGKEGLREVFKDIYAPKAEPVLGGVDVELIDSVFTGFTEGELIPGRIKNKLGVKVLFNDTPMARRLHKIDKQENRISIILDQKKYPLPAEIEAYEDKIALMSFRKDDFVAMIIENKDLAITLKSILSLIFDHFGPGTKCGKELLK